MTRLITVLVIAVTLSVGGALGLVRQDKPAAAAPATVVGDDFAGMHGGDLDALVAGLQDRLAQVPGDAPSWATLALAYVEQARTSGDPTLYTRAAAAVRRSMQVQPTDNAAALTASAAIAAARHRFGTALGYARQALAIDAYQPGALAIRVDALTELGRYAAQLHALQQADHRQPGLPIFARYSYAYELRGHLVQAHRVLGRAGGTTSPANRAFVLTLQADLDRRLGRLRRAATELSSALEAVPGYVPAMASRARLAIAQGRPQAALRRWETVVAQLPLPEYLTELGELRLSLGQPGRAAEQFAVVDTTMHLLSSNGVNTDLESALFEADHGSPRLALESARAEWGRRHSIHVADVLGWALHRTGHDQQALHYARLATRLGTDEGRLWLHRGTIEAALGLTKAAREHLRRGLGVDPGLNPWQADRGRAVLQHLDGRS